MLCVVVAGTPVICKMVADAIQALRVDERAGIKERFRYQSRGTQDDVAGPKPQASLHPVNARMPRRFGNLGKKMLSHLPRYFELVVAPRTVNHR